MVVAVSVAVLSWPSTVSAAARQAECFDPSLTFEETQQCVNDFAAQQQEESEQRQEDFDQRGEEFQRDFDEARDEGEQFGRFIGIFIAAIAVAMALAIVGSLFSRFRSRDDGH